MLLIELRFWETIFSTKTSRGLCEVAVEKPVPDTVTWNSRDVLYAAAARAMRTLKYASACAPAASDAMFTVDGASTLMLAFAVVNPNVAVRLVAVASPVLKMRTPTGNTFGPVVT